MTDDALPQLTKWRPDELQYTQDEVDPAAVLEGNPEWFTSVVWTSEDKTTMVGAFRGTPGRFNYEPPANETTFVRSGRVIITAEDGSSGEFGPGDVMSIKAGAKLVFDVQETLEDTWVWSSPDPIEF